MVITREEIERVKRGPELPTDPRARLAYERRQSGVGTGTFEVVNEENDSASETSSVWNYDFE